MKQAFKNADENTAGPALRKGSNQSGMRDYNERLVMSLIREEGALAKAEIARKTGLSAPTVSAIIRSLETDGLLERGEPLRGKIGQPSVPVSLARDGAYFLGLKIGRRNLELVLTDFMGDVRQSVRANHPYPTPEQTIGFANAAIGEIRSGMTEVERARIAGLGIAMPFQLWEWANAPGGAASEMEGWKHRDIGAEIGATWGFPAFVCNDASAACGAELVFGDQGKPRSFLYFFVGFFIGGGLVLDGALYTGPTSNAAALGSMIVQKADGSRCQLVDVASLSTLEREQHSRGDQASMTWDAPDSWDISIDAFDAWCDGAADGIAQAILASICLIDVGQVFIDGWMPAQMRATLVQRVRQNVLQTPLAGVRKPEIAEGTIGPDARVLGAASLPLSERFLVDRNSYLKVLAK
ncbi:MAG: ROK family transcriptional regulator [Paracoccaceae bacterium]|nr:ROK family transcriptional regulator [Paracoccaceae bacterium]